MKPSPLAKKKYEIICPAPIAVIDVGTNTIRLLVGCVREGKIVRIATNRFVTRLGKDMQKTNRLSLESIEKSIISIVKIEEICNKYCIQKIIALGTSALREAENSEEFLKDIKRNTGIDIEIIEGEREAELTLKGILSSLHHSVTLFPHFLLLDIGGGSTEWVYCLEDRGQKTKSRFQILNMGSIPIGAVKLFETFIKHDPPTQCELQRIKDEINDSVNDHIVRQLSFNLNLFATGGTATTIAAIDMKMDKYNGDKIHLHKIPLSTLKTIYKRLIALPYPERSKIKGLEPEKADIIISGTLILLSVMETLNIKEFIVSDYGLLEGAMISYYLNRAIL